MIWHNLGWLYVDQGRWQDANFYLETALTTSRKLGDSYMEIETLIGLVKYAIARQDDLGAVVRLEALDRLIDQNPKYNTYRILYTQLKQDCHNLPGIHHR